MTEQELGDMGVDRLWIAHFAGDSLASRTANKKLAYYRFILFTLIASRICRRSSRCSSWTAKPCPHRCSTFQRFFETSRRDYHDGLRSVSEIGPWQDWIEYFFWV